MVLLKVKWFRPYCSGRAVWDLPPQGEETWSGLKVVEFQSIIGKVKKVLINKTGQENTFFGGNFWTFSNHQHFMWKYDSFWQTACGDIFYLIWWGNKNSQKRSQDAWGPRAELPAWERAQCRGTAGGYRVPCASPVTLDGRIADICASCSHLVCTNASMCACVRCLVCFSSCSFPK